MTIRWSSRAQRHLTSLTNFVALESPKTALKILSQIEKSVENLPEFPNMGKTGRLKNTRELIIQNLPYIISYTIFEDTIWILAIMHTSRKWTNSFEN
jgi:toxin ParE1/3/4